MHPSALLRAVLPLALLTSSCGGGEDAEVRPAAAASEDRRAGSPREPSRARGEAASSDGASPAPARVRFDLARHLARAELRRGDALHLDLGVPGGHKYTLGGWRTRAGGDFELGSTRASVVRGVTGYYLLPIESAERCHVSLRVRGFASRPLALYVDDETIGNAQIPIDGSWSVVSAQIPAERCTPGEHELRVRVTSTGSAPGISRAGVAVDWIRLGPAPPGELEPEGPPSPAELSTRVQGQPALRIPDGWSLSYSFEVPAGARLSGILLDPDGAGRLEVAVERDGEPSRPLRLGGAGAGGAGAAGAGAGGALSADLGSMARELVRLSLRARGGDVTLVRPAIVTDGAAEPRAAPRMTNVLVYLTDTLRADHLRAYAPQTRVQTPGLDAWARRAATFLAGHAQENWTKPSCATLLSGLYPWEHHATSEDAQVPGSVELMSERLREEGFYTGAFVANGFVSDRFGFRQGWSTFRNYVREGRRNMARFVAEDVLRWLDERPADRPFFLYVHTIDPHVPYMPPSDDLRRYDPRPYDGIVDFGRDRQLLEGIKAGRVRLNARDRVRLEALYDGEITYHDRHFASVMEALERRGLAEQTLVVFTSDHGEELFDHGSVGHGHSVYEELIRVPLILRWPGLTDGAARIDEAVGLVDVMPTVLDALELPAAGELSGRSLAPLLRGQREDAPRPVVTGFMEGWRTVVVGRYKLIQRTASRWMVYDLAQDPGEERDLSEQRPLLVRYLRGLLGLTLAGAEQPERAPAGRVEHAAERTHIDETLRRQLEALGYAGASRAPGGT